jgi:hypothetical protein
VLANLAHIYNVSESEEPNWKNIVYRARLVVVASMGKDKWPENLPLYFINHYLYIRDILLYAFEGLEKTQTME